MATALVGKSELAKEFGVTESLLENWMSGSVAMPDQASLALAEFLDKRTGGAGRKS
jgi:transcriptional regulator with XRE-family HTH domain